MKLLFIFFVLLYSGIIFSQNRTYNADPAHSPDIYKKIIRQTESPALNSETNEWQKNFTVPGIVGSVYTMADDGENLYIGGQFNSAGGAAANNIVKWDGEKWISLGEGPENGVNGGVHGIAFLDGKLFVGGLFNKAGSVQANGVAYWDGNKWNTLGADSTNGIRRILVYLNDSTSIESGFSYSLYAHNNLIYIGGWFNLAGTDTANGIAAWNIETEDWEIFNGGLGSIYEDDPVYAYSFQAKGDELFVGGKFYTAGGVSALNIAKWNGSTWDSVGHANNWVLDMAIDEDSNVYAAGMFDTIGNIKAPGIAKWNGITWEALGDADFAPEGSLPFIKQVAIYNKQIYVGGTFDRLMDKPANSLAKWNGSEWHIIPGLRMAANELFNGGVTAIQVVKDKLYVGGSFTKAGEELLSNVAEWNEEDSKWIKLPGGAEDKGIYDGFIYGVSAGTDGIYAGGSFSTAGGIYARNIARWATDKWESLGSGKENGIDGTIYTVAADSSNVFAGGYFGHAGTTEAYHIAQWDGSKWLSVGIGVGGIDGASVYTIVKYKNYLYAGGHFAVVGDEENFALPANSIARFNLITRRWESFGSGLEIIQGYPGFVYSIEIVKDTIYIGGDFAMVDGKEQSFIAALKDSLWQSFSAKMSLGTSGPVTALKEINGDLIAGGYFNTDSAGTTIALAKWDGTKWKDIAGGLNSEDGQVFVEKIIPFGDGFIAAGIFEYAGNELSNNIALYDGNSWKSFGSGTNGLVSDITISDDYLFAGGGFDVAGGHPSVSFGKFALKTTQADISYTANHYALFQNYPNPFNPATTIRYSLPKAAEVKIKIYDILGNEVRTLVNELKQQGVHQVEFDAAELASGVYFYSLITPEYVKSAKMILIK